MHKLAITFSFVTSLSFILVLPGKAQVNLTNGLVAYYPFSGNANDASGNGNNAIFNNATLTTDRFGNPGSAYYFNGIDNYIEIPNNPSLNTNGQISLCVYIKPMGFYYGPCHGNSIIEKTHEVTVAGDYFLRFDDGPYTSGANCANVNVDTIHQVFYANTDVDAPADFIQKDQWYCLLETYDGTYARMYLDGVLKSSVFSPGITWNNDADLFFGRLNSSLFPYWFNGVLDEIRIYNRALNQTEVSALCGACTPLQASTASFAAGSPVDSIAACEGTDTVVFGHVPNGYANPVYVWQVSSDSGVSWMDIPNSNQLQITLAPAPVGSPITYQYRLVVTDTTTILPAGCPEVSNLLYFTSVVEPVPDFSFADNICNPLQGNFSAIAPAGSNFNWLIDGISYSSPNPSHLFNQYGSYPIKLVVSSSGGCSDSIVKNISFQFVPGKAINNSDTTICVGQSLPLKTKPAVEFCWSPTTFLDDPAQANPVATPPVTTKYYFTARTMGVNLLTNGDFSQGNTGFTSAYNYDATNVTEGEYFVGPSPHAWFAFNPVNCGDHTSGSGNMLMINGYPSAGVSVWREQVNVIPNTDYAISTWIQSLSPQNPATLQFYINGAPVGNVLNAVPVNCTWQPFITTWNSGTNTIALIDLIDTNIARAGNDFAMDDISFAVIQIQKDSITVTVETPAVKAFPDTTVCRGMPVPLRAAGATNYSWSPGAALSDSTIANPVARAATLTSYILTGTSSNGCVAKDTIVVALFPNTTVILTSDTTICLGDAASLQASGGLFYTWSPAQYLDNPGIPDPVARPPVNTRYFLTATDANHCTETDSVTLTLRPVPVFAAPPADLTLCQGNSVVLGKKDATKYVYEWSPGISLDDPSSPAPVARPTSTTLYTVKISDSVCSNYDSSFGVSVKVNPSPVVIAQKANDIDCSVATSRLNATGATSYEWSPALGLSDPNSSNPVATIDSTTTFIVRGTDRNGCFAFDTLTVNVTATGKNLFVVPNGFSPNGDGHNDCFGIRRWGDVTIEEFSVYDRWGVRVFTTRNPSECWDGNFRGKPQETGTYAYVIKARSFCGEITRTGVVVLVR